MKHTTVPISSRALIARINRSLRDARKQLIASRPNSASLTEIGRYYVVDVAGNRVIRKHVELEAYAREIGVLRAWERLAE